MVVFPADIDTLDVQKTTSSMTGIAARYFGATLVAKDAETGDFIPYLAEKWQSSADGMQWEFTLRKDVKFHDGTPFTAKDYAYTIQRALDPKTASMLAASQLQYVAGAEAVYDYTLRLTLKMPNFSTLDNICDPTMQPLSKTAVDKWGDDYARHPVGVGPFRFKEWTTAKRIVLERNPDFAWPPNGLKGHAPYLDTIEFRIISDSTASSAALENGEISYGRVPPQDIDRIVAAGKYNTFDYLLQGSGMTLTMNDAKSPFTDVKVRQAFNMAVDRDALIKVVLRGHGVPQYGPLTASVRGYWPGVEQIGYHFDLDKAKALMVQAGYSAGSGGVLQKDGQPLQMTLTTSTEVQLAELLQQQLTSLGVNVKLEQLEPGVMTTKVTAGNFDVSIGLMMWPDCSLLGAMFLSQMIGVLNDSRVNDPALDQMILKMIMTGDAKVNLDTAAAVQKYVVEQAFIVPLYTEKYVVVVSKEFKGIVVSSVTGMPELFDAYYQK